MTMPKLTRAIVFLGAALFGSACILQIAAPTAQVIVVTATPGGAVSGSTPEVQNPPPSPTFTQELAQILTATFTPSQTATSTAAPVTMTAGQALSCVKGPDWKLYEWVVGIADGETVVLVARAVPEIPDYYVVRKSNGTECWAFGGSSAISGSTALLPVRETPPLPEVTYVIENKLQMPLCFLYIRGKDEAVWGANRLTVPNIAIDATFSLNITAGYYDVQIKDCITSVMYEEHDRAIGSDPAYRYQLIAVDVDFSIQNNLPYSLCHIEVRVAPGPWQNLYNHDTDGGSFAVGMSKNFTLRAGTYTVRRTRCTDVVLPATGIYVHPGMSVVAWS
jgi:hypothetical protein